MAVGSPTESNCSNPVQNIVGYFSIVTSKWPHCEDVGDFNCSSRDVGVTHTAPDIYKPTGIEISWVFLIKGLTLFVLYHSNVHRVAAGSYHNIASFQKLLEYFHD